MPISLKQASGSGGFKVTYFSKYQGQALAAGVPFVLTPPAGKKIKLMTLLSNTASTSVFTITTNTGVVVTGSLSQPASSSGGGRFWVGGGYNYGIPTTSSSPQELGDRDTMTCPPIETDGSITFTSDIGLVIIYSFVYGD